MNVIQHINICHVVLCIFGFSFSFLSGLTIVQAVVLVRIVVLGQCNALAAARADEGVLEVTAGHLWWR